MGSGLRRAAVTGLPFTESVLPMYVRLSAADGGATAEPPPHADNIASAIIALASFTKSVVFNYGSPLRVDTSALYFPTETALRCDLPQPAKIAGRRP